MSSESVFPALATGAPPPLQAAEHTGLSYYVRAASAALRGAPLNPVALSAEAQDPSRVLVISGNLAATDDSTLAAWTKLLQQAGFAVLRTDGDGLSAHMTTAPLTRAEITTTGLLGARKTQVAFPDYGVGGTVAQHIAHSRISYTVTSSRGTSVDVSNARSIHEAALMLAHHWSLPTALDVPFPDPKTVEAARDAEKEVARNRTTLSQYEETAQRMAKARRPGDSGDAQLAAACRVAAMLWQSVGSSIDTRKSWVYDRDQLTEVLRRAREAAREGGFHTTDADNLAEWITNSLESERN